MENFQSSPLKVYIQDIYRAERNPENKYIYNLFGLNFKNIMIHGVITAIYNTTSTTTNIELSDPTGTISIYFDDKKNNLYIPESTLANLNSRFEDTVRFGDNETLILRHLRSEVNKNTRNIPKLVEGGYVSVIGDIFVDDLRNVRMVSAYECSITSPQRDIVWLEELKYLYQKYYLKNK